MLPSRPPHLCIAVSLAAGCLPALTSLRVYRERHQTVVVREIESDDDGSTSSSDDGDEELRARRARDREIQRAKAQKLRKPTGVMHQPNQ